MESSVRNSISDFASTIEEIKKDLMKQEEKINEAIKALEDKISDFKEEISSQKSDIETILRENTEKLVERINMMDPRISALENKLSSVSSKTTLNLLLLLLGCGGIGFLISKLLGG